MGVKDWFGFSGASGGATGGSEGVSLDEYLEGTMHGGELLDEEKYTYVKSLNASMPNVMAEVSKELKKGNIVLLDTEALSQTNRLTLKQVVTDLKGVESEIDGDMGRISETKILIVPGGYRILKRRAD
jgi:SepF-like predicted cell division protein (DUF552 family)